MGIEKQRMEDGYSSCGDLTVCSSCFGDVAIKQLIEDFGEQGACSYCSSNSKNVIDLNYVVRHIVESINHEWDDPANAGVGWESAEGGWLGVSTLSTYELLTGELELDIKNDDLLDDINSSILNSEWCETSPYSGREDEILIYEWESFSDYVKYQSRYVIFKPDNTEFSYRQEIKPEQVLKSIGSFINRHELVKSIETTDKIYRVRIMEKSESITKPEDLCSPPKEHCTIANRMSPAGIAMFYGAFDIDTAIIETYEPEKIITKKAICGIFNPIRTLTVIDLSAIPSVPSLFDEENRYDRDSLSFLNSFVKDFSKPIDRKDRAHVDYVPTQIVTEYFRHVLTLDSGQKIDGVIYPSSKSVGSNCIVLFADSTQCDETHRLANEEQILMLNKIIEKKLARR